MYSYLCLQASLTFLCRHDTCIIGFIWGLLHGLNSGASFRIFYLLGMMYVLVFVFKG